MTRKDYTLIADAIIRFHNLNGFGSDAKVTLDLAVVMAQALKSNNQKFDKDKFIGYIYQGLPE